VGNEVNPLRYPLGLFKRPDPITDLDIQGWISDLEVLPRNLRRAVTPLAEAQLATLHRPGGWTVLQIVHHLADSHLNGYLRLKWALTEDRPTIKPYREDLWAALADSRLVPATVSLDLLDALHCRWVALLRCLSPDQFAREFRHPESGVATVAVNTGLYAWHGRHHLAHITAVAEREGWITSRPATDGRARETTG